MKKNKKIKRNEFQLQVQTKYRTLIKESRNVYKRSRDKKVTEKEKDNYED